MIAGFSGKRRGILSGVRDGFGFTVVLAFVDWHWQCRATFYSVSSVYRSMRGMGFTFLKTVSGVFPLRQLQFLQSSWRFSGLLRHLLLLGGYDPGLWEYQ